VYQYDTAIKHSQKETQNEKIQRTNQGKPLLPEFLRAQFERGKAGLPRMAWCNSPSSWLRVVAMMQFDQWLKKIRTVWLADIQAKPTKSKEKAK
jgi:hypothetical protein